MIDTHHPQCVTHVSERVSPLSPVHTQGEGQGEGIRRSEVSFEAKPVKAEPRHAVRASNTLRETRMARASCSRRVESAHSLIITGNFATTADNHWTVPVGGGGGKLWRVGKVGLPVNTQVQAFYNAETPEFGPDWQLRLQLQFLFPR